MTNCQKSFKYLQYDMIDKYTYGIFDYANFNHKLAGAI